MDTILYNKIPLLYFFFIHSSSRLCRKTAGNESMDARSALLCAAGQVLLMANISRWELPNGSLYGADPLLLLVPM